MTYPAMTTGEPNPNQEIRVAISIRKDSITERPTIDRILALNPFRVAAEYLDTCAIILKPANRIPVI